MQLCATSYDDDMEMVITRGGRTATFARDQLSLTDSK